MTHQDTFFLEGEGDRWFRRNQRALDNEDRFDWPLHLIDMLDGKDRIRTVAELGCANGWRLRSLKKKLGDAQFFGVEASQEAVEEGRRSSPDIQICRGLLSDVPLKTPCDLVIVYFVLHWVDRSSLSKSISEVDRMVKDGGILVLGDFLPHAPQRRRYHHAPEQGVFTYKQDYARIFEALGTFKELTRVTYDHDHAHRGGLIETLPCDDASQAFCSVLRKSNSQFYSEPQ